MGLDMWLYAEKYVSEKSFAPSNDPTTPFVSVVNPRYAELITDFPEGADEAAEYKNATVRIKIGDWRKVNQVHGFFIKECNEGVDNCKDVWVSPDKLRTLRATIEFLLENKDSEDILSKIEDNLPLADGFFFGSREIDDYYWYGLENTIPILNKAITLAEDEDCEIYYLASW
jgi:hypothetical protein